VSALLALLVFTAACSDDGIDVPVGNPDLFGQPGYLFSDDEVDQMVELTADVVEWEVYPGELVEVWGYNGQYPGPTMRWRLGDKVRVTLTNNLPEATTIHFHGLDVPNDQDGVPNITQPAIEPGESWTYEFKVERVGTTAYHTHVNTLSQLGRGLFGTVIVESRSEPQFNHDFALALHEIEGNYTINGHSFPSTLENDLLSIESGDTARVRFVNMGSLHHPMHLHGHQFRIYAIDGNVVDYTHFQNTIDIAPGTTADVIIEGTNPGTWTFHCHIISHVANKGVYPGGMLTILDYEDHTSYMEEQAAAGGNSEAGDDDDQVETPDDAVPDGEQVITASNLVFDKNELVAAAGEEFNLTFDNQDANIPHNVSFYESSDASEEIYLGELFPGVERRRITFTAPDEPGTYFFRCDVHPTTMVGDFVVR
jgi:FtsP/CotA-like multicopper oxidase with cupredoxin domain